MSRDEFHNLLQDTGSIVINTPLTEISSDTIELLPVSRVQLLNKRENTLVKMFSNKARNGGDKFNFLQTSSGSAGSTSTYRHFKNEINESFLDATCA